MYQFERAKRTAAPEGPGADERRSDLAIQRRMQVGRSNDPSEAEADRTAEQVVAALQSGNRSEPLASTHPLLEQAPDGKVRRSSAARSLPISHAPASVASRVQRRAPIGAEGGDVSPDIERRIQRLRGGGSSLDEPVRRSMEGAFGTDFSSVRVHSGAESRELNDAVGATAFTTGNDIFFRDTVPDATTKQGQSLLAHELTHTIQQGGSVSRTIRRKKSDHLATLVDAQLNCVKRDEPTIKGHAMSFDLTLSIPGKAGVQKVKAIDAEIAHSLYGVTMEWWEEIIVDYDFKEADPTAVQAQKAAGAGGSKKPWSDIYLSNPQSQTFFRWKNSIAAAQAGTLAGNHVTGVNDMPAVNLSADSYKRRTLRFRINATDAHGASVKFDAIQVLVADNGALTSTVYEDSTGTKLTDGTGERELMRYSSTVPLNVRHSDAANFAAQIRGKKRGVRKYVNTELTQVEQQAATMGMDFYRTNRDTLYKELQQSNRLNGAPLIPGTDRYVEFNASDGGLLVAQVVGKTVKRMFYTPNQTRQIPVNCNGTPVQMTVREFEQIPPEFFTPVK